MTEHPIPACTYPEWRSPRREEILVDDTHAVMTQESFRKLEDYSCSVPGSTYPGMMWKTGVPYWGENRTWFLRWYGDDAKPMYTFPQHNSGDDTITIHSREILIA